MQKSLRIKKLKSYVQKYQDVTVNDLQSVIGVSESTIRRDIKELVNEGFLHEHYGSVTWIENKPVDILLTDRLETALEAKKVIALKAAKKVRDGSFIYIDAGSTTYLMIKYLENKQLTVVTNGINIAIECAKYGIEPLLIGGTLKSLTMACVGDAALDQVKHYTFDQSFMGANGIDDLGFTTPELKEGTLKKTVIENSVESFICADRSKKGVRASYRFADFDQAIWIDEGETT